jgi:glycerol-3-phosphate dehydrogenase (NAD(P)+)
LRREPVTIVGAGAWGTALGIHAARLGHPVRQWVYEADLCAEMRERRENGVYLPGVELPAAIEPVAELASAVEAAELVVAAVPSPYARTVYGLLARELGAGVPVVVATKGIEVDTLALPLSVAAEELGPSRPLAVLSGPSFAREVATGLPAALVVASADADLATRVQTSLASPAFRVYTNSDAVGVQVAGALKNVMAIAAGAIDGLEMGTNCMAALVTRGLAEIMRLGLALGGNAETFAGLAGLGDLVLTCTGQLSRNRGVGFRLGRGESLERILGGSRAVAEGVRTTRSARELAARLGVEMPIVEQVHRILYAGRAPREAVTELMTRPLRSEAIVGDEAEPAS